MPFPFLAALGGIATSSIADALITGAAIGTAASIASGSSGRRRRHRDDDDD